MLLARYFWDSGGVLFYTTYNDNYLGQHKPGSTYPDKRVPLDTIGVEPSVGSLAFVPAGMPGAGRLKITSYGAGIWYDTSISPDGQGTYNLAVPTKAVRPGNPLRRTHWLWT